MLVLSQDNQYSAPNVTIKIDDRTTVQDTADVSTYPIPEYNVLIPTFQDIGPTNVIELFRPGYQATYAQVHGLPNALKYGFGPDFIYDILSLNAGVGVYTVNLRGSDATHANVLVLMNYEVKEEAYQDSNGRQYYIYNGEMTTGWSVDDEDNEVQDPNVAADGEPVTRNVLHVKYETASFEGVSSWLDMVKKLNSYDTSANTDTKGTLPMFGVIYRGASNFGNNAYFNMTYKNAEYDGNTYYSVSAFDGQNTITTENVMSLDTRSGQSYGTTYFIETVFNNAFYNMRFVMYNDIDKIYDIYNKYLITKEEFIEASAAGTEAVAKTIDFGMIDPFTYNGFAITVDEGSLDVSKTNAFTLTNGSDGTETADDLYKKFFNGDILDANSVIRYRVNYVPDVGYSDEVKASMIDYIKRRNRFTVGTIMVGQDTFRSAMLEHYSYYFDNMPYIRQIAKVQSPMMYNAFCRRTMTYPASYFDVMEWVNKISSNGHPFQPFAGANVRWRGFIEDTMAYPTETPEFIQSLTKARVNVVMKDNSEGAYISDQLMNCVNVSDQIEFNNSILITSMLYDLLDLVHANHFKFNEEQEVKNFKVLVDEFINAKYTKFSASLSTEVYRMGTIGRAAQTNKILVTIDLKDINRYTNIELVLVDN